MKNIEELNRRAEKLMEELNDVLKETQNLQAVNKKKDITEPSNDGSGVTSQFTNLPIGLLICAPFLEIAHGQQALCDVYIETLMNLAYVTPSASGSNDNTTRMLDFKYERPVADSVQGTVSSIEETIHVPLLSLVPIPAFMMDSATVSFNMEVNVANSSTSSTTEEVTASADFKFWTCKTNIQGKVTNSDNRSSNSSAKATYNITVHASQQPASEGMAKLTSLLAETMEPIKEGS